MGEIPVPLMFRGRREYSLGDVTGSYQTMAMPNPLMSEWTFRAPNGSAGFLLGSSRNSWLRHPDRLYPFVLHSYHDKNKGGLPWMDAVRSAAHSSEGGTVQSTVK